MAEAAGKTDTRARRAGEHARAHHVERIDTVARGDRGDGELSTFRHYKRFD
jgi:hypothetical protein